MSEKPTITRKEEKILKWHHSGKSHAIIQRKYHISKTDLIKLIIRTAKGYNVEKEDKAITCPLDGDKMSKEDCEPCNWLNNCWS